jgi:integrase
VELDHLGCAYQGEAGLSANQVDPLQLLTLNEASAIVKRSRSFLYYDIAAAGARRAPRRVGSRATRRARAVHRRPEGGGVVPRHRCPTGRGGFDTGRDARRPGGSRDQRDARLEGDAPAAGHHLPRAGLPEPPPSDVAAAGGMPASSSCPGNRRALCAAGGRRRRREVESRLIDTSRYRLTLAMRQTLNAAVRWRYLRTNPVAESGPNPGPCSEEFIPFTREEIDALDAELGPIYGPLGVFAAETGLRTNEWVALERREGRQDRQSGHGAAPLRRSCSDRVPEDRAVTAQRATDQVGPRRLRAAAGAAPDPARVPGARGRLHQLYNWRTRDWDNAVDAAGIERRGPYHLRHTFATRRSPPACRSSSSPGVLGASVEEIDRTYGHLARDANDSVRARLRRPSSANWH